MPAPERPRFSPADEAKIHTAIQIGELVGQDESKDRGSQWATRTLSVIDMLFEHVLHPLRRTDELFKASIAMGAPPVVIHLMGFEDALCTLRKRMLFQAGIAVSLGVEVDKDIVSANKALGISRVTGNVLKLETWVQLPEAGLVLWDAAGGLNDKYITDSLPVYSWLLSQALSLVSPNFGVLLAEIPNHVADTDIFHTWINKMEALQTPFDCPLTPGGRIFAYQEEWLKLKIVKTPAISNFPTI